MSKSFIRSSSAILLSTQVSTENVGYGVLFHGMNEVLHSPFSFHQEKASHLIP